MEACDGCALCALGTPFPICASCLEQSMIVKIYLAILKQNAFHPPLNPGLRSMAACDIDNIFCNFLKFSAAGSKPTFAVSFAPRPYKTFDI
jgi:hypothetical protein